MPVNVSQSLLGEVGVEDMGEAIVDRPFSPDRRRWFFEPGRFLKASDVSLGAAEAPNPERLAALVKSPRAGRALSARHSDSRGR